MKISKKIYIIILIVACLSLVSPTILSAGESEPDPNMTKWGPKLTKAEIATIAKLSTQELAEMLKTGDTLHAYAALKQLKSEAHGGLKKNFDLLLKLAAETRGNMIVEGLLRPIKTTATPEDKHMVDKLLDFLENELKREKPSVFRDQAIRSIAGTVYIAAAFRPKWRPYRPSRLKDPNDLLKVPYGNKRVVNILIGCLESKDWRVRSGAIHWLGNVGANDLATANDIVSLLNAQAVKEEGSKEKEKIKAGRKKVIQHSLKRLNREIDYFMDEFKKVQMMSIMSGRSEPEPTPD